MSDFKDILTAFKASSKRVVSDRFSGVVPVSGGTPEKGERNDFWNALQPISNIVKQRLPRDVKHWPSLARDSFWSLLRGLNAFDKDHGGKFSPLNAEHAERAVRQVYETTGAAL